MVKKVMFLTYPLFLDFFGGFFSNVFNIVMMLIFVLIGVLLGVVVLRVFMKPKNQIMYFRERDGRAEEYDIQEEDAISLRTRTDPELRFFKWGRSYEFRKRGRAFTRFLGKEGTAYTWRLSGFGGGKGNPKKKQKKEIEISFPSLEAAVESRWGKEFYATVPDKMRETLRDNNLLVTVNLEPGIVPEKYKPITESVILQKADEDMAALFAASVKGVLKTPLMQWIFILGSGVGAGWILATVLM